jgi:hypothetical protein
MTSGDTCAFESETPTAIAPAFTAIASELAVGRPVARTVTSPRDSL